MAVDVGTVFLIARIVVGFLAMFWILPRFVLPVPAGARTGLDRAATNFVRWMGLALVFGHLLVALRLFHLLPIALLCGYGYLRKRRSAGPRGARLEGLGVLQSAWLRLADLGFQLEQQGGQAVRDGLTELRRRLLTPVRWLRTPGRLRLLLLALPAFGVLGWSLATRMDIAARFATLASPQSYVMLTWTKTLLAQTLYPDGVYPAGQLVFLALVGKGTPGVGTYEIVRFVGPLQGALLVAGLYYAVIRLSRSVGAAMVAATAFGVFGTAYVWHEPWIHQTAVRPPELALAVILFAVPTIVLAVTEGGRDHLVTLAAAAVAVSLIHPVAAALLVAVTVLGALGAVVAGRFPVGRLALALAVAIGGVVLGQAPSALAALMGVPVHRGLDNPYASVSATGTTTDRLVGAFGTSEVGHVPLSYAIAGGLAAVFVVGVVLAWRGRPKLGGQLGGLAGAGAAAVLLYDVRWTGLGSNHLAVLGNLTGVMLALALGAAAAAVFTLVEAVPVVSRRPAMLRLAAYVVLGTTAATVIGAPLHQAERSREPSEYEATATVTREIMRTNEAFGYTVIGTPQQAQAVAGSGSFIQLWVFARDVTLRDARDPGFVVPDVSSLLFARDLGEALPIPTQNIYIFVEKNPFPVAEQPPVGPSEEYYYDAEKRGRIMALVYAWAEYYRHYHTDMDILHEDDDVVVYRIRRRPNTLVSAVSPQFKDYTWQPGVLFDRGPTDPDEVVIPWRES